eukprot:Gb_07373 [translate_table: standard]
MSESDGVTNHVTRMQELKDQLLSIDQKIDDKELVTMLLNSLPRSYNTFFNIFMCFFQNNSSKFWRSSWNVVAGGAKT